MPRPQSVPDDALIFRLNRVFRAVGYEGASLTRLSEAAGLGRASLYSRFPGGKQAMAEAVLDAATQWLEDHLFQNLQGPGDPAERLFAVERALSMYYQSGKDSCLIAMLSHPYSDDGPFSNALAEMTRRLVDGFAHLARDAGLDEALARSRAERAFVELQGSLIFVRASRSTQPFRDMLARLRPLLLDR
ncbi:MAG: TetR/AcrR family transcriptional regulator [Pseudomonadota bacterium]